MTWSLVEQFGDLPDPRRHNTVHDLRDILVVTICAVICGAEDWVSVERFGHAKAGWLSTFLPLKHGIPSHDTLGCVFAKLDPEAFAERFSRWIDAVRETIPGDVVAIDGKTLRRSFDRASNKTAIHMVSAWSAQNRLVLGQVKTDDKSNEITAIPELLRLLALKGCIVTIDAMGCQKAIASTIVDQEADYVLSLKGNQGRLHDDVQLFFDDALAHAFNGISHDVHETVDGDHGRIERRRVWCTPDIDWLDSRRLWRHLRSLAMVESHRSVGEETTVERRYFISSLPGTDARQMGRAIRAHWGIETRLHWVLDVAFREDDCRVRQGYAAQNFATIRHIALNLLKREASAKVGVKNKRL